LPTLSGLQLSKLGSLEKVRFLTGSILAVLILRPETFKASQGDHNAPAQDAEIVAAELLQTTYTPVAFTFDSDRRTLKYPYANGARARRSNVR